MYVERIEPGGSRGYLRRDHRTLEIMEPMYEEKIEAWV
jgi:hypothetical protein